MNQIKYTQMNQIMNQNEIELKSKQIHPNESNQIENLWIGIKRHQNQNQSNVSESESVNWEIFISYCTQPYITPYLISQKGL